MTLEEEIAKAVLDGDAVIEVTDNSGTRVITPYQYDDRDIDHYIILDAHDESNELIVRKDCIKKGNFYISGDMWLTFVSPSATK